MAGCHRNGVGISVEAIRTGILRRQINVRRRVGIIQHELGGWWAFAALVAAFGFRFMLPLTIGTYFGAVEVLGWPWWGGVLIAAPGLLLIVPSILAQALEGLSSTIRR